MAKFYHVLPYFIDFIWILLSNFRAFSYAIVLEHFNILYHQLDPIPFSTSVSICSSIRRRCHNAFVLVATLSIVSYGIFVFHYEATGEWILSTSTWSNSPYGASHQTVPRSVWRQIDMCYTLDTVLVLGIFSTFLLYNGFNEGYMIMYDAQTGCLLHGTLVVAAKAESNHFMTFVHRSRLLMKLSAAFFDASIVLIFLYNVWRNSVYTLSLLSGFYWLFAFPLVMSYIIYSFIFIPYYVIIVCRCMEMAQHHLVIRHLASLNRKLQSCEQIRPKTHWRCFVTVNGTLLTLCSIIQEYNRYCRPLLSALFPYYISVPCYLLHSCLFLWIPLQFRQLFLLTALEMSALLAILTHECARSVKLNCRIERLNREFAYRLSKCSRDDQWSLTNRDLVKAEMFQLNRSLRPYAFQLWGNYRITSKTFYMILLYISTFFMFISKNQLRQ